MRHSSDAVNSVVLCGRLLLLFACISCCIETTSGCFIRNCPIGGKRSSVPSRISAQKECMACGPNGLGQCVGPNTCCGQDIGCFMGTQEAKMCGEENDSPIPCRVDGAACGRNDGGRCVAEQICCNEDKCSHDSSCQSKAKRQHDNLSQDLLRYMHQLMTLKSLGGRR
ncbi:hypothetical protein CAPTEDRAFT_173251 [Capitella teleta]|uniref:Uncharacterized protein n=1 Tax=Capitella teleta TaxID=283909 RepID=R7TAF5_CAPTE|nr:hypothetical protein CAPTEDRAFT_173251 [Capitella teleta]|eukprot:ELT90472.1 hypothetical protein CAPTEDRAFT_173251 [Capitella teleta]